MILLPTIPGSDPKRRCHSSKLRTATFAAEGDASDESCNVRPRAAFTPNIENRFGDTFCTVSCSGESPPVRIAVPLKHAANFSNTEFCSFQFRNVAGEVTFCFSALPVCLSQTITSLLALG